MFQYKYTKTPKFFHGKKIGYKEGCSKEVIGKSFKDLFKDLRLYSYKEPGKKNQYIFFDGPIHPGAPSDFKRRIFGSTHASQPRVVKVFERIRSGGQFGPNEERLRLNNRYFYIRKPESNFFQISAVCFPKMKKVHH